MTKLTEKERIGFETILKEDIAAINRKFMNQIKDFWHISRKAVTEFKGFDKLAEEKIKLREQIKELEVQVHEIENVLNSEKLRPEQIVELGGTPNSYGQFGGASFYGIPVTSQFEYEIVEYIREHINLEIPAKILGDMAQATLRELTMSGTFETAKKVYSEFYELDFRSYGVDIPMRIGDLKKDKKLLDMAKESLQQVDRHMGLTNNSVKNITHSQEENYNEDDEDDEDEDYNEDVDVDDPLGFN